MKQKITTESWINSIPEEHRKKYDYSEAVYTKAKDKVKLRCKVCDFFFVQEAFSHASGCGCPACAKANGGSSQRLTADQFIEQSKKANGEQYGYELVEYKNSTTKVDIVCHKDGHGVFSMLPLNRVRGQQCPKCGNESRKETKTKSQELFIEQCMALGKDNLSFESTVYTGDRYKVVVNCKDHGPFSIVASNLLQGQGCRSCAKNGYRHNVPGYVYVLSDVNITKVGVTNRNPLARAKEVQRSGGPLLNVVAKFHFEDGSIPSRIESACLKYLSSKYRRVEGLFDGSTECFLDVDVPALINFITPIAAPTETVQTVLS